MSLPRPPAEIVPTSTPNLARSAAEPSIEPAAKFSFAPDRANLIGKLVCIGVLALLTISQYRQRVTPFDVGEVGAILAVLAVQAAILWEIDRWILQRMFDGRLSRAKGIFALASVAMLLAGASTYIYVTLFSASTFEQYVERVSILWLRTLLVDVFPLCGLLCLEFFYRQKHATTHNEALRRENLEARYRLLEQQLNPHFLFNSLSVLHTMAREQSPRVPEFILRLTNLYRRILANRDQVLAPLGDELDFVAGYLAMLQERFEGKLRTEIDVPEAFRALRLPTFSLYVLVENCAKHNVISASAPLTIRIELTDRRAVRVRNNHQPRSHSLDGPSGLGLENLRNRYRLLGRPDGVLVAQDGREFSVTLQLLE